MKYEAGEEVKLTDGARGKVIGTVGRRAKGEHEHRMVQFPNALSAIYHVSELLPVEVANATEPIKTIKTTKSK